MSHPSPSVIPRLVSKKRSEWRWSERSVLREGPPARDGRRFRYLRRSVRARRAGFLARKPSRGPTEENRKVGTFFKENRTTLFLRELVLYDFAFCPTKRKGNSQNRIVKLHTWLHSCLPSVFVQALARGASPSRRRGRPIGHFCGSSAPANPLPDAPARGPIPGGGMALRRLRCKTVSSA